MAVYLVVLLVAVIILLIVRIKNKGDLQEPPEARGTVPFLGSIYGLFKHGMRYFDIVSEQQRDPIFTVNLLGQKNYVVTSPELVQAVQRNVTSLSFSPAMIPAFRRMMGFSEAGIQIIFQDAHTEKGMYGQIHHIQKSSLLPGTASLDELCISVRAKLMAKLQAMPSKTPLDFYSWLQQLFMTANNSVVYGPEDPFTKDPSLNSVFWYVIACVLATMHKADSTREWEANIKTLLLGIPWFLSPKSHGLASKSRSILVEAFTDYLERDGIDGACSFMKNLSNLGSERGLSNQDNARALLGSILAIIGNTIPTVFWLLLNIYSRPELLETIRGELQECRKNDDGSEVALDVTEIRSRCPTFMSTFDETLRITSGIATIRYTNEDTWIANKYLLKKGATVQMPTAFIHTDPGTWGHNAKAFNYARFLDSKTLPREQKARQNAAYRPFGGGNTLCPGRHLASYQILSFAGTFLLGFDMYPATKGWEIPDMDRSKLPLTSMKPTADVAVTLVQRSQTKRVRFG